MIAKGTLLDADGCLTMAQIKDIYIKYLAEVITLKLGSI